jgi:hypothetical protein
MAALHQAQRLFLTASTSSPPSHPTRPRRGAVAPCRASVRVPNGLATSASPADGSLGLKLDSWVPTTTTAHAQDTDQAAVEKLRALAAAVNTVEHGGQAGMVFELCRNSAGFYRKVQEDIEATLEEADAERRENGEVFRTKVALILGRSASDLRQFRRMASASFKDEDIQDFAGKLF